MIINAMTESQFSYHSLIWMFSLRIRKTNNLINKVHERSLGLIRNFETLPQNVKDTTIHQRNFQIVIVQVYKTFQSNTPSIMENLKSKTFIILKFEYTVMYELVNICYRIPFHGQICHKNINRKILYLN